MLDSSKRDLARRHVHRGQLNVWKQEMLIKRWRHLGQPTDDAEGVLRKLTQSLRIFEAYLAEAEEEYRKGTCQP
jgi:hypothetical protein